MSWAQLGQLGQGHSSCLQKQAVAETREWTGTKVYLRCKVRTLVPEQEQEGHV
jgi:hypothetical protein